jgi:hydroxypyruvate isomerase
MFRELPILERFAAARAAGFDGVEIQALEEGDSAAMAEAARAAGATVVLVNVDMGDFRAGGPGLSGVPGREEAFRNAVGRTLDAARVLGAGLIHLGPSRIPPESNRAACFEVYRRNIEMAVAAAAGHPARLLIEPLNVIDSPTILLADFSEATELIRAVGSERLGLQFDIYHAAMNGVDVLRTFHDTLPSIGHIQFSDAPGRHEPGTGRIEFAAIFTAIAASSYSGWAGAEYFPATTTAASFGWLEPLGALLPR